MTYQPLQTDAPPQTAPVRWDRVCDVREKIARGDYDRLTDAQLADAIAPMLCAEDLTSTPTDV